MILYESRFLQVDHNTATGILICSWKDQQTTDGITDACGIILGFIREKKINKILNDNTSVKGPWKDVAEWVRLVWFPSIIEAGVKQFAWVQSQDVFARASAKIAVYESPVIMVFKKFEDAQRWLEPE